MAHPCNPSTHEAEAGGLQVWDHLMKHRKFQASLDHMKTCLERKTKDGGKEEKERKAPKHKGKRRKKNKT